MCHRLLKFILFKLFVPGAACYAIHYLSPLTPNPIRI
jgi:hypothetical protein